VTSAFGTMLRYIRQALKLPSSILMTWGGGGCTLDNVIRDDVMTE
jgi:hypothetical protein